MVYTSGIPATPTKEISPAGLNVINGGINVDLAYKYARFQRVTMTGAGLQLRLPNPLQIDRGSDIFVSNIGVNSFSIRGPGGSPTIVASVAAGKTYYLYVDSTNNWFAIELNPVTSALVIALAGFALSAIGLTLNVNMSALAGAALGGTGQNPGNVNVDNSTLEISSDHVRVKDLGITGAKFAAATITADKFASSVSSVMEFSGTNATMAMGNQITILTPGVPFSFQYQRRVMVMENIAGPKAVLQPTSNYEADLGREDRVVITKLSGGVANVRAVVLGPIT